jgi:hypothetical protein
LILLRRFHLLEIGGREAGAADRAGVVHLQPLHDAGGVVEVTTGEPPRGGGEGEVVLADGAYGRRLGHLDRRHGGDGGGRGRGLALSGDVPLLPEGGYRGGRGGGHGGGIVVEAADEAAEVGAGRGVVDAEVEVVGLLGGGVGEEPRRRRGRRGWGGG